MRFIDACTGGIFVSSVIPMMQEPLKANTSVMPVMQEPLQANAANADITGPAIRTHKKKEESGSRVMISRTGNEVVMRWG